MGEQGGQFGAVSTVKQPSGSQFAELAGLRDLVLNSVSSVHTRRAYGKSLDDFLHWYAVVPRWRFSRAVVQEYRVHLEGLGLSASTVNVRLAAIRKLAAEAAENGLLSSELAAGIERVRGARRRGVRAGNWLTLAQAGSLLEQPNGGELRGLRDRAILALLLGCGLRRSELSFLGIEKIQERDGRWVLADIEGKGNRWRTVPIPLWVKNILSKWTDEAGITAGRVFRSINKAGRMWGAGISEKVIWWVVKEHANGAGLPMISPHDLRRTCAKLCRAAGGDLEQIQFLLGHSSVQTTEKYLGTKQNLAEAVNDHIKLGGF